MKILLEQVVSTIPERRTTLIDSTVDTNSDEQMVFEAIEAFDKLIICAGHFTGNGHIYLEINGEDIGYGQLNSVFKVIEFLKENP